MRFLLDEDVNPAVAAIAQGLGLDVISVHEIVRRGYDDESQLRYSASQNRVFITRNRNDFLRLSLAFFQAGEIHAGLLIVPYSLPNHLPERIAHALKRWLERGRDPGAHFIDYLSG